MLKLDTQRDDVWAERYRSGETINGIALSDETSTDVVWRALKRGGVSLRPRGTRPGVSPKHLQRNLRWAQAYRAGESLSSIAATHDVSEGAVRAALKKVGLVPKAAVVPRKSRAEINAGFYWHQVQRLYGLSRKQWDEMLIQQNGCCALCGGQMLGKMEPHVDHDHATGKVRGLLHGGCNTKLAAVEDTGFLAQMMAYLEACRGR